MQFKLKKHMCFVHADHESTSSIKINFKFLTVSLFHYKWPFSFQKVPKWAWIILTMHLKPHNIPKVFSDWISYHNFCTWLAKNISRDSSFCLLSLQQYTCSELLTYITFALDLSGFFEFLHTNRSSHLDLFLKNIKLFMNLEL